MCRSSRNKKAIDYMKRKKIGISAFIASAAAVFAMALCSLANAAYPQLNWVYRVKPDAAPRSIVFAGDNVIALQSEKNVAHFIDAATGGRIWAYALDRPVDIFPLEKGY